MRLLGSLSLWVSIGGAVARSPQHVGKSLPIRAPVAKRDFPAFREAPVIEKRATPYLNANTSKFAVDGAHFPEVKFDIGESYAGLLPISSLPTEKRELFFWFFPSTNPKATDEITIWLNGGPGCSSLEGLLQENGPFLWQYGTLAPLPNPYSWTNLTNMVWVEQPIGTGFSQGKPNATSEADVAAQFMGFFKNFVNTFGLQNRKVFITGESYAGQYVPYIADAMFNAKDKVHFNVDSIMIYDPVLTTDVVSNQMPTVPFVDYWSGLFAFNSSFLRDIHHRAQTCGYTDFFNKYLVFPPAGILPTPPDETKAGCNLWNDVATAAFEINPCFDYYQIATTCPVLYDVLGFPGSFFYTPDGGEIYFNRSDVQKALHVPPTNWNECNNGIFVNDTDTSPPPALSILPSVIERTTRTIIGHGALDYILLSNGTLMAIQNMTWGGKQGFQTAPNSDFFVPYHIDYNLGTLAGAGVFGKTHTERKLTYVYTYLSGHMVPQYAPSAAYRQLEFLLGRIGSLTENSDFTTQTGNFGNED